MGRSQVYLRLRALVSAELLAARRLVYGQPTLYVATREGLAWAGLDELEVSRVSVALARHWALCTRLAVLLERTEPGVRGMGGAVGATGSGMTVTQAWIAGRFIEHWHGAVAIDPKGDRLLRGELHRAARRAFREWTPDGPEAYNPFAHGSNSELADQALAGETYTEPHYRWSLATSQRHGEARSIPTAR
jgi:hypothetical protein